jgi:hypothetical protein
MSDQPEISLSEVFKDTKARRRFLNLVGKDMISADELEALISRDDAKELVGWLNPIYEAGWGAIYHGNSARFCLYHFNGYFFSGFDMDDGAIQGPFKTAIDAADAYSCSLSCQLPDDDNDCSGAVGFTSRIESDGRKVISRRTANAIFAIVSGYEGVLKHRGDVAEFDWAEVIPGVFFIDPMKDEIGAELNTLNQSKGNADREAIVSAQVKLEKLMRKQKYFDFTFDNSSGLFKSLNESYVMKIPMEVRGKLAKFPTEWVRFCLPNRVGRRIKVRVGLFNMHWNEVSDLISTGLRINAS